MSEVAIEFLGAAGTVTGSRFLLTCGDTKVMIDCGMFQGLKELRLKNWNPLGIDPAEIDAVVLTHAHLDHCGYLPKLGKDGFVGKVFLTEYTAKLVDVILRDSARIQTEDAKYAAKKKFSKHNPPMALYEEGDVEETLELMVTREFLEEVQIAPQVTAIFHPSGHILGAAFVEVEFFGKFGFKEISDVPVDAETYAEMVRSNDDGVAEFLDLARVKQNTLGNTRMLRTL